MQEDPLADRLLADPLAVTGDIADKFVSLFLGNTYFPILDRRALLSVVLNRVFSTHMHLTHLGHLRQFHSFFEMDSTPTGVINTRVGILRFRGGPYQAMRLLNSMERDADYLWVDLVWRCCSSFFDPHSDWVKQLVEAVLAQGGDTLSESPVCRTRNYLDSERHTRGRDPAFLSPRTSAEEENAPWKVWPKLSFISLPMLLGGNFGGLFPPLLPATRTPAAGSADKAGSAAAAAAKDKLTAPSAGGSPPPSTAAAASTPTSTPVGPEQRPRERPVGTVSTILIVVVDDADGNNTFQRAAVRVGRIIGTNLVCFNQACCRYSNVPVAAEPLAVCRFCQGAYFCSEVCRLHAAEVHLCVCRALGHATRMSEMKYRTIPPVPEFRFRDGRKGGGGGKRLLPSASVPAAAAAEEEAAAVGGGGELGQGSGGGNGR